MKNALFAELFRDAPDKYPIALEQKFERILTKISELWRKPEMADYFEDLIIDKRGGRQGFPPDVAADIFRLSALYEDMRRRGEIEDPWAHEGGDRSAKDYDVDDLARAIEANDLARMQAILETGMSVDIHLSNGWTPLQWATFNSCEDAAMLLVQRGATVGVTDADGYTPLHWASLNGFARVVPALIEREASVHAVTRFGISPLMQAAGRGHVAVVRILLDSGATVNQQDLEGWTPLHKAVANKHLEVALMLYRQGANPALRHKSGVTAAEIARQSPRLAIRKLFDKD